MNYSNYTLEQIKEYSSNYMELCTMFLNLTSLNDVKEKLKGLDVSYITLLTLRKR